MLHLRSGPGGVDSGNRGGELREFYLYIGTYIVKQFTLISHPYVIHFQLTEFLMVNLTGTSEYAALFPTLHEMLHRYHLPVDVVFMMARSTVLHDSMFPVCWG